MVTDAAQAITTAIAGRSARLIVRPVRVVMVAGLVRLICIFVPS
jgi:hypothetical protein